MAAKNKFMNAMKMPAIADMFSSEADRQRESGDLVTEVPLSELHPFVNHPFEVRDDEDMIGCWQKIPLRPRILLRPVVTTGSRSMMIPALCTMTATSLASIMARCCICGILPRR